MDFQSTFTKTNYSKMKLSLNLATMNTTSVWIPLCKQKIPCYLVKLATEKIQFTKYESLQIGKNH